MQVYTVEAEHDGRCADDARCSDSGRADKPKPTNADAGRRRRRRPAAGGAVSESEHGSQRCVGRGEVHARQRDAGHRRRHIARGQHGQNGR